MLEQHEKTQGAARPEACLSTDFSPPASGVLPETPCPAQQAEPVLFPEPGNAQGPSTAA